MSDGWQRAALFVAQGFGSGWAPVAPGTFGSLVGVLWMLLLAASGNLWAYVIGTVLGLALSVWLTGIAERTLGQTDPSSVVLDEVTAVPVCFLGWFGATWLAGKTLPALSMFFTARGAVFVLVLFGLFRVLDAVKPWPIRQVQQLAGGWGVTADDVLAAGVVALVSLAFLPHHQS